MQFEFYTTFKLTARTLPEVLRHKNIRPAFSIYDAGITEDGGIRSTPQKEAVTFLDYEGKHRTTLIRNEVENIPAALDFYNEVISNIRSLFDNDICVYGLPSFINNFEYYKYSPFTDRVYTSKGLYWPVNRDIDFVLAKTKDVYKDLMMAQFSRPTICLLRTGGGEMTLREKKQYLNRVLKIIYARCSRAQDAGVYPDDSIHIMWWDNRLRQAEDEEELFQTESNQIDDINLVLERAGVISG